MARLRDLATMIRSKNAGPFELTLDFIFIDEASYVRVKNSGVLNRALFARTYGIEESVVKLFHYDPANAIKVTVPRSMISGNPGDTDVFGGQQHGPFVDIEVPEADVLA